MCPRVKDESWLSLIIFQGRHPTPVTVPGFDSFHPDREPASFHYRGFDDRNRDGKHQDHGRLEPGWASKAQEWGRGG